MRAAALALALVLATSLLACGDDESALQGIYTLSSWTENPDACDAEGAPSSSAELYSHFFVREDAFFGQEFLSAPLCSDLAECREKAGDTDTIYLGEFTFDGGDDDGGWTGSSAFLGGENCDGEVQRMTLTGEAGVSVTIRVENVPVTGVPRDADDFCDLDAAFEQAEGQPCASLEVVTGAFLEGL